MCRLFQVVLSIFHWFIDTHLKQNDDTLVAMMHRMIALVMWQFYVRLKISKPFFWKIEKLVCLNLLKNWFQLKLFPSSQNSWKLLSFFSDFIIFQIPKNFFCQNFCKNLFICETFTTFFQIIFKKNLAWNFYFLMFFSFKFFFTYVFNKMYYFSICLLINFQIMVKLSPVFVSNNQCMSRRLQCSSKTDIGTKALSITYQ